MNCCTKCFLDIEVIAEIERLSEVSGTCDYCKQLNVPITSAIELSDFFQDLIASYRIPDPAINFGEHSKTLFEHLKNWNIFSHDDLATIQNLVQDISSGLPEIPPDIFTSMVVHKAFIDGDNYNQSQKLIENWNDLKNEIKHVNRYILHNDLNLTDIGSVLRQFEKIYRAGHIFYRSRISNQDGLTLSEMGKPPTELAKAGRANPQGIPYLYLSNDLDTTIYEVRAAVYDYITVGTFELTSEIRIASVRNTGKLSPFIDMDINNYILYKGFLLTLESELMKPLRRLDSELDYIPTQYFCEFIKSLGYDGVEYSSSLDKNGYNIALFNDDKITCTGTKVHEVKSIMYEHHIIT